MQAVWDVLSNKNPKKKQSLNTMLGRIITPMMLRARVNHQRNYEIYTLRTTSDIDVHDLRQMFESDPQHAADLIRVRGNKLFCNRNRSSAPPVIV
jgi:hypothetical protein